MNNDSGDNQIHETQILESRIWDYKKWTYIAPTYPLSIFLDCRTQREFVNPDGPPILLNDEVLDYIESEVYRFGYERGDPLIIISPTPVFGFEHAESVQRFLTSISGTYEWDLETWRANATGFIKFLTFLSTTFKSDYCIILSGDVHYAFTMKVRFDLYSAKHHPKQFAFALKNDALIQSSLPLAQLTSSPLRSNSLTKRKLAIMILNLIHKVIITRKIISRTGFFDTSNGSDSSNLETAKDMKEDNLLNRANPNYSKHGKEVSFPIKIKTIFTSLINRYFVAKKDDPVKRFPDWRETRMLVTPKGHGTTPVLANNNIGSVSLNLKSRTVEHTLFFLENNRIRTSVAKIKFDVSEKGTS